MMMWSHMLYLSMRKKKVIIIFCRPGRSLKRCKSQAVKQPCYSYISGIRLFILLFYPFNLISCYIPNMPYINPIFAVLRALNVNEVLGSPFQRCQPLRKNRNFSDFNLHYTTLQCHACLLLFLEMTVKGLMICS